VYLLQTNFLRLAAWNQFLVCLTIAAAAGLCDWFNDLDTFTLGEDTELAKAETRKKLQHMEGIGGAFAAPPTGAEKAWMNLHHWCTRHLTAVVAVLWRH
jgi:hypothetical protein